MADPTASFIMFTKYLSALETMPDPAAGKLCKALMRWVSNGFGEWDPVPEIAVATFASMREDVLDSKGRWIETCRKNSKNASIGWERRREREKTLKALQTMREDASASDGMQTHTKDADKDKDKDKDSLFLKTQGKTVESVSYIPPETGVFKVKAIRELWSSYVLVRRGMRWPVEKDVLQGIAEDVEKKSHHDPQAAETMLAAMIKKPFKGAFEVSVPDDDQRPPAGRFADVPENWDDL